MKRKVYLVILVLFIVLAGIGIKKYYVKPIGTVATENVLKLRIGGEPSLLNPILSTDTASSTVEQFIFNGLMKVNPDLELVPDLAISYEISEDGKAYTFVLKDNVYWHDGKKFSAEDVKFTFEKILDPKTNTVRRSNCIIDGAPIEFIVLAPNKIKMILPKPFAPFLTRMGMGILPKHILKGKDVNNAAFNRRSIGTGPFVIKEWKSGQFLRLARNDKYFAEKPKIDGILIKVIPDTNTALIALKKGEIDVAGIPGKDLPRFTKDPSVRLARYQDLQYTYLGFNLKNYFFKDKRIRQAIAHAINKDAIVRNVLADLGAPAHLPISPVSWAYPKESFDYYPYNKKKSKQLLKEAGLETFNNTNILHKNGRQFSFTLITNKGNKDREKTAQLIQSFLSVLGIKVNIQLMEWSSFVKLLNSPQDPKPFDAVLLGWGLSLDPDCYSTWHSSQYPKGFNFIDYNNKAVDKLIAQGRTEMNVAKRKAIYQKLFPMIAEDVPYLFLYYPDTIVAINKRVKGLSKPGPAGLLNPIEDIYLDR
jgi:peptide/nickel transport system substrate-binding protein